MFLLVEQDFPGNGFIGVRSYHLRHELVSEFFRAYGSLYLTHLNRLLSILKGVFAKNERGYRLNAIKKTSNTEERSAHTN